MEKNNRTKSRGRRYSVLVVDDDPVVCKLLVDFFNTCAPSRGRRPLYSYEALPAANGVEALACIREQVFDIVISDIRMPVMDGIELFRIIRTHYPQTRHILMTAYNVDEYLSLIRRHNIGNILVKDADFNLEEVECYVQAIVTGDIFGLERYFSKAHAGGAGMRHGLGRGLGRGFSRVSVDSYARSEEVCSRIAKECGCSHDMYLQMAVDELIANAVFHGVLRLTGIPREQWRDDCVIDAESAITVTWACDEEKVGVAVMDPRGNLKKVDALRFILRSSTADAAQNGLLDQENSSAKDASANNASAEEHGRGLYLVRRFIDRFIINIDPGKRTECIVLQYFNREHLHQFKPIQINEI